jgi:hypothetical protein
VFINEHEGAGEKELMCIPLKEQSAELVQKHINERRAYINDLPLSKKLRYFFIHDGKFYKIAD